MTKKQNFAAIREILVNMDNCDDLIAFVDKEVELLNSKSGALKKPTEKQKAHKAARANIYNFIASAANPVSMADIMAAFPDFSNQYINSAIIPMRRTEKNPDGIIERIYEKGVPYFYAIAGVLPADDDN